MWALDNVKAQGEAGLADQAKNKPQPATLNPTRSGWNSGHESPVRQSHGSPVSQSHEVTCQGPVRQVSAGHHVSYSVLTWSVVCVVELHHHRVPVVGDAGGHAVLVGQEDGRQAAVVDRFRGDDVDGRLAVSLGEGVGFMPCGGACGGNTGRAGVTQPAPTKGTQEGRSHSNQPQPAPTK